MAQQDFIRNVVNPILTTQENTALRKRIAKEAALYIIDKELIYDINTNVAGMDKASADKVWNALILAMSAVDARTKVNKSEDYDRINKFREFRGYPNSFIVSSHDNATKTFNKAWTGALIAYDSKKYMSNAKAQQEITGLVHAGHGNVGLSVSGITALRGIQAASQDPELSGLVKKLIDQASQQKLTRAYYNETEYTQFTHEMVLDDSGNVGKHYTIVLKTQSRAGNLEDSAGEILTALRDIVAKDLPNLKSSMTLKEGIEATLISALLRSSKSKNFKGAKPRKTVSVKNSKTVKRTRKVPVTVVGNTKVPTNKPRPRQDRTGPTINLVALINAKLPEEIRKRMTYPRLQWRTGRFAGSVRALSAEQTRNGGVTVGYTYQRNPYEVFEPGRSSLATPARDPKQLIDLSIRAIAQQYVQGRFYTRRM